MFEEGICFGLAVAVRFTEAKQQEKNMQLAVSLAG